MKLFFAAIICATFSAILFPAAPIFAENVDIQAIAQNDQLSRVPFDFSNQGVVGESFSYKVTTEVDGLMTIGVSCLDNSTVSVAVTAGDGRRMFSEVVTGSNSRDLWIASGDNIVTIRIVEAAGTADIGLSLLVPAAPGTIAEEPPPLSGYAYGGRGDWVGYMLVGGISALLALMLFYIKSKLVALKKPIF